MIILGFGTPTAWFLASHQFKGRSLAVTLVELPIVLPPAVAGIGLLVAFGRFGLLGSTFDFLGINVSFNLTAVVMAITLVSGPFYVRQAIASFEAVDWNMIAASRTLGAGAARTFFRVTLPLARGGLVAGESLCLARGWASSARRFSSRAACRAARRRFRSRSTTSSKGCTSRRRSRSVRCS